MRVMPGFWLWTLCWPLVAWGLTIRVGVAPVDFYPWLDFSTGTNNNAELFIPAFLKALSETAQLQFNFVVMPNGPIEQFHPTAYRGLIDGDYDITFDALFPGVDPDNIHKLYPAIPKAVATYSAPMYSQEMRVLLLKQKAPISFFRFLEPFHWKLWLVIVAALFVVSGVMVLIHVIVLGGTFSLKFAVNTVYHSWAAFLGGEDYEWLTAPAKILRIALLLLVFISGATYTANLAAFFTKPSFNLVGPQNLDELETSTVCVSYPQNSFVATPYVKNIIFPPMSFGLAYAPRAEWCLEQMRAGKADAFFEQGAAAHTFELRNCDHLASAQDIGVSPSSLVWVMLRNRTDLLEALNGAMLGLQGSPAYQTLRRDTLLYGRSCQTELIESDTQQVTLQQMEGFVVIFFILVGVAVAVAIAQRALMSFQAKHKKDGEDVEEVAERISQAQTDSEMIQILSRKVDKLLEGISAKGEKGAAFDVDS